MNLYSIPADFSGESVKRLSELNQKYSDARVAEVYGQMTLNNIWGSGRTVNELNAVGLIELERYNNLLQKSGIDFNYTLNGTCMGNYEFTRKGVNELKAFLRDLHDLGIRKLTIALPSIMEAVLDIPYEFEVKASTLCQITSVNKAVHYLNSGVNRIVVDESCNRNFSLLKRLSETVGNGLELIVNVICNINCTYRMFHYNEMSHGTKGNENSTAADYYSHRCIEKRMEQPENFLKMGWIRPEDIHYYTEIGIRRFKIQGRQAVMRGDVIKTLDAYFRQNYDGNLLELLDVFAPTNSFVPYIDNRLLDNYLKPFISNSIHCSNDCQTCGYCSSYVSKYLDRDSIHALCEKGRQYYLSCDPYRSMIKEFDDEPSEEEFYKDEFEF